MGGELTRLPEPPRGKPWVRPWSQVVERWNHRLDAVAEWPVVRAYAPSAPPVPSDPVAHPGPRTRTPGFSRSPSPARGAKVYPRPRNRGGPENTDGGKRSGDRTYYGGVRTVVRSGSGERPSRGRGTGVPDGTPARVRNVSVTGRAPLPPSRLWVPGRRREVSPRSGRVDPGGSVTHRTAHALVGSGSRLRRVPVPPRACREPRCPRRCGERHGPRPPGAPDRRTSLPRNSRLAQADSPPSARSSAYQNSSPPRLPQDTP